jgi:hypothetical protein
MACVLNANGSFDCTLDLSDGTQFAYSTFRVDGVYPEGISCNPRTGQLYAFDSGLLPLALGCKVNLETGAILRSLAPPMNLHIMEVV